MCVLRGFSCVQLFVTLWTVACQTPLSVGFSRQEYWSGLLCPPPGDLPDPGIEYASPCISRIPGRFSTSEPRRKPEHQFRHCKRTCWSWQSEFRIKNKHLPALQGASFCSWPVTVCIILQPMHRLALPVFVHFINEITSYSFLCVASFPQCYYICAFYYSCLGPFFLWISSCISKSKSY